MVCRGVGHREKRQGLLVWRGERHQIIVGPAGALVWLALGDLEEALSDWVGVSVPLRSPYVVLIGMELIDGADVSGAPNVLGSGHSAVLVWEREFGAHVTSLKWASDSRIGSGGGSRDTDYVDLLQLSFLSTL